MKKLAPLIPSYLAPASTEEARGEAHRLRWQLAPTIRRLEKNGIPWLSTSVKKILDYGAGEGSFARLFARKRPEANVVAVDVSDSLWLAFNRCRARAQYRNLKFVKVAPNELGIVTAQGETDLKAGSFDLVFARLVLQHVADPLETLRQLRALLKPGGQLRVEDMDWTLSTLWPELPAWSRYRRLALTGKYRKPWNPCPWNPCIARDLPILLRQSGFAKVLVQPKVNVRRIEDWNLNAFPGYLPKSWHSRVEATRKRAIAYARANKGYWLGAWWEATAFRPAAAH
jgi:SAM-dependent methyltransferase